MAEASVCEMDSNGRASVEHTEGSETARPGVEELRYFWSSENEQKSSEVTESLRKAVGRDSSLFLSHQTERLGRIGIGLFPYLHPPYTPPRHLEVPS